ARNRGGRAVALPAIPWQAIVPRWACEPTRNRIFVCYRHGRLSAHPGRRKTVGPAARGIGALPPAAIGRAGSAAGAARWTAERLGGLLNHLRRQAPAGCIFQVGLWPVHHATPYRPVTGEAVRSICTTIRKTQRTGRRGILTAALPPRHDLYHAAFLG